MLVSIHVGSWCSRWTHIHTTHNTQVAARDLLVNPSPSFSPSPSSLRLSFPRFLEALVRLADRAFASRISEAELPRDARTLALLPWLRLDDARRASGIAFHSQPEYDDGAGGGGGDAAAAASPCPAAAGGRLRLGAGCV